MPRSEYESTCYWVMYAYYVILSKCNVWSLLIGYKSCRLDKVNAFVCSTKEGEKCHLNDGDY